MTDTDDTAEHPTTPVTVPPPTRPNRVTQVAAWVGIVAGTVFVVAVIFFSGFVLGKNTDGDRHHGGPRHESVQFHRGSPPPMGPPNFPGPGPGNQLPGPSSVPRP